MVGVGDMVKRHLALRTEALVSGGTVAAHAHHLVAQRKEPLVVVPHVTGFADAAGGVLSLG